jgi:transcriptional regulator mntR
MDESKKKDRYEDAKKFVRYSDGAKMYSMGMTKFQEVQNDFLHQMYEDFGTIEEDVIK